MKKAILFLLLLVTALDAQPRKRSDPDDPFAEDASYRHREAREKKRVINAEMLDVIRGWFPGYRGSAMTAGSSRRLEKLESTGIVLEADAEAMAKQARELTGGRRYVDAANMYEKLRTWYPGAVSDERVLRYQAGLYHLAAEHKYALDKVEDFGENYPESEHMPQMIRLAFEIGSKSCASDDEVWQTGDRVELALRAFDFVNRHDPYSLEAALGLYSSASMLMKENRWEEAAEHLIQINKKLPSTAVAARAEVALAECYLGDNKGSHYAINKVHKAKNILEDFLLRYPESSEKEWAQLLLNEANRRIGQNHLAAIRFYISQKKWDAVRFQIKQLLAMQDLDSAHKEAETLLAWLDKEHSGQ